MATKMYILLETDKSQADPVSRLMTQLVDQLKHQKQQPNDALLPAKIISHSSPEKHESSCHSPKDPIEIIIPSGGKRVKTAITAETLIDSCGQAKAKVLVSTNSEGHTTKEHTPKPRHLEALPPPLPPCIEPSKKPKEEKQCPLPKIPYCELVDSDYSRCKRRNGLDPTHAELRGMKKFEYVPLKSKIPDYRIKEEKIALSDHLSNSSRGSVPKFRSRRSSPVIQGLRQDCAKNIPEERLVKYKACVNRRNGLQDRCDPIARNALKKCCKANK